MVQFMKTYDPDEDRARFFSDTEEFTELEVWWLHRRLKCMRVSIARRLHLPAGARSWVAVAGCDRASSNVSASSGGRLLAFSWT